MDESTIPGLIGCGVGLVVVLVMLAVVLAISLFIAYQLYDAMRRLPARFQQMSPGLAFVMVVPVIGIVWVFFVVIRVSQSYQQYFTSLGRTDVGDCGYRVGLGWAGTAVGSIVPVVGMISALVSLVLMIVYLIEISKLKGLVVQEPGMLPPLPPRA